MTTLLSTILRSLFTYDLTYGSLAEIELIAKGYGRPPAMTNAAVR